MQSHIECTHLSQLHCLENIVGRVLSFLELSSHSTKNLTKNVIQQPECHFILEIDNTVPPITVDLTDQNIIPQVLFENLNILY